MFSVGLQLSGFFTLASAAMWIDEVCHGPMKAMTDHSKLYLAAFIVTLVVSQITAFDETMLNLPILNAVATSVVVHGEVLFPFLFRQLLILPNFSRAGCVFERSAGSDLGSSVVSPCFCWLYPPCCSSVLVSYPVLLIDLSHTDLSTKCIATFSFLGHSSRPSLWRLTSSVLAQASLP